MTVQNLTSVVIVTYYTGPILDQVIAAVLAQSADSELILVNNGNVPEVEQALVAKYKDDPQVRLMTGHGNIGLARGYNLGARAAKGQNLLLLGHKCVIPPNAIAKLYEQQAAIKKICLFGARIVDASGKEIPASRRSQLTPKTAVIEALRLYKYYPAERLRLHEEPVPAKTTPIPAISSHFMFMVREHFETLHGFNEAYFYGIEDFDFCYRFRSKGGSVAFVPDLVAVLHNENDEAFDTKRELYKAKGMVRYFHENYGDSYAQPLLLGLYAFIWIRYAIKAVKAGKVPSFKMPAIPALPTIALPKGKR